jgi:hypothetical protein
MKRIITTTLAVFGAAGALLITAPDADARTFHHHRARVGVYIGAPIISPYWYNRPYYYGGYGYGPAYYPPVVVQEQPTVYVEQQAPIAVAPAPQVQAQPQQQQQQYWHYCQDTQTYYPHAQTCASPWQRVIPHAPQ